MSELPNALTVDVEDYFHVSALAPHIPRSRWPRMPCRVERNTERILEALEARGARATFFVLGWVAERHPVLVRRIVDGGHELASHGYGHRRVGELGERAFREDAVRARELLEQIGGVAVRGYRAPSFSIGARTPWAHRVLRETGHRYSSSVYPVRHDHYGDPEAPRFPHQREDDGVMELPVTTVRLFGRNWPAAGGGYFRLLPYAVSRRCLQRVHAADRRPCIFYFHPWEIDPGQPRQPGLPWKTRFRHYLNLERMEPRLHRLLGDFRWDRLDRVFPGAAGEAAS